MKLWRVAAALLLIASAPAWGQGSISGNNGNGIGGNPPFGGGGGTPGGSNGFIQFNNGGTFGGIATTGTGNVVRSTSGSLTNPTISGGTIDGSAIGGTTPAAVAATTLSATGTTTTAGIADSGGINTSAAYSQNGSVILSQVSGPQGSLQIGQNAACNQGILNVCVGAGAGQSATSLVTEATLGGVLTGNLLASGSFDSIWGEHGLGYATVANGTSGLGDDVFRNVVSNQFGSALGKDAHRDWFGDNNGFYGAFAGSGNAASIGVSGTLTAGDVLPLIFTGPLIAGSPYTLNVTVPATPTQASIATAICTAFAAAQSTAFTDNYGCNTDAADTPGVAAISHNGTSTQGGTHTVAVTLGTFTGTETVTIGGGAVGSYNFGIGNYFMHGYQATSAAQNVGGGYKVFVNATTLNKEVCFGDLSCTAMTSDHNGIVLGAGSGGGLNGSFRIAIVATGCSSPTGAVSDVYIFGDCTTNNGWFTSGDGVLIGNNPETSSATNTGGLSIMNAIFGASNNGNGPTVSGGCIYFYSMNGCTNGTVQMAKPLLLDASIRVGPVAMTIPTGAIGIAKETVTGTAPGTSGAILQLVCGTTTGTAKLVALAGTSTTPAVILDNIGSSVGGC